MNKIPTSPIRKTPKPTEKKIPSGKLGRFEVEYGEAKKPRASRGPIIEDTDLNDTSSTNKTEVEFQKNIKILKESTGEKIEAIKNKTIELLGVLAKKVSDYTVLLLECIGHTIEVIADSIKVAGYEDLSKGMDTFKAHSAYSALTAPPNTGSENKDLAQNLKSLQKYVGILSWLPITEINLPFIRNIADLLTEPNLLETLSNQDVSIEESLDNTAGLLAVSTMLTSIKTLLEANGKQEQGIQRIEAIDETSEKVHKMLHD